MTVPPLKRQGVLSRHGFKSAIEIGEAFKTTGKTGFGHIFIQHQQPFGLIDPVKVQKMDKGEAGHFFKIPTKSGIGKMA